MLLNHHHTNQAKMRHNANHEMLQVEESHDKYSEYAAPITTQHIQVWLIVCWWLLRAQAAHAKGTPKKGKKHSCHPGKVQVANRSFENARPQATHLMSVSSR